MIITQNGEAKMVVQDIHSYERTQETLALLKLLSLSRQQIATGQVESAEDVIVRLRKKYRNH